MDTAVSGFVSAKLSDRPELSSLAGFTDDEVITLLRETVNRRKCHFSYEELKKVMKDRYDGYRFAKPARSRYIIQRYVLILSEHLKTITQIFRFW